MQSPENKIHRRTLLKKSTLAASLIVSRASTEASTALEFDGESPKPDSTENTTKNRVIELPDSPGDAEIDLRLTSVHLRFEERLTKEQSVSVRNEIAANYQRSRRLRNVPLNDFDGPSSVFHPVRDNSKSDGLERNTEKHVSSSIFDLTGSGVPEIPDNPEFATLTQLAIGLRQHKYTSVGLVEIFLSRLEKFGPKLNCIATSTKDLAMRQAKQADDRFQAGKPLGLLDGIPYGAKDLLSAAGYPTSNGCAPFIKRVLDKDATVIQKLSTAGAVLIAKLSMVECAGGLGYRQANASAFGPGLTPYDVTRWSGGSSSGSGSAVAAGLVPFALGSETWGSITTPSSYCGLTGLRPTYGRVSRAGAFALSYTLDKIGPMARTAMETEIILKAISGHDQDDPSAQNMEWFDRQPQQGNKYRIAVLKDGVVKAQPEVRENFLKALDVFREIADVEEIDLPAGPYADVLLTILGSESASAFEELVDSGLVQQMTAPEDRIGGYADRTIPAMDYIRALRLRGPLCKKFDDYLRPFDAVVTVPTSATAPLISQNFGSEFSNKSLGGPGNLCGSPALVMPSGLDSKGLPTAIQLDSRVGNEMTLVRLGQYFQSKTTWHLQRPDLSKI